jgi:two-component system, OmpR family, sensor kinase
MSVPRRRKAHRLRTKLIVAILALLAAICASIGIISHLAMTDYLNRQIDGGLHQAASRVVGPDAPPPGSPAGTPGKQPNPTDTRGQRPGTLSALFSQDVAKSSGVVQTDGSSVPLTSADLAKVDHITPNGQTVELTLSSGRYRISASTAMTSSGEKLVTGLSTAERDSTLNSLNVITGSVSLAGLAIIGLSGTVIVRRSLRPLDELSAVATTVATLPLDSGEAGIDVRIPPMAAEPGTEVGEVGIAFNNMLDHLTRAFAARHASEMKVRQFVADASHELRTPLTSIRGYTELILLSEKLSPPGSAALQRVDKEAKRMSALVEDLLLLARLDEGQRGEPGAVDLTELLMETVQDSKIAAPGHQWSLDLPEEPVVVHAVETELRQILINLLSNAHKHTEPGTRVRASLSANNSVATLSIANNGEGIPAEFLAELFTRFSRADTSRANMESNSSGLGLAIVKALAEANHGTVTAASSGGSTRFTVQLPTV